MERRKVRLRRLRSVLLLGITVAVAGIVAYVCSSAFDDERPWERNTTEGLAPAPDASEIDRNWPRFRGPNGSGRADLEGLPLRWDGETGENICWKTPLPLDGASSPIVWGERIFLTGADARARGIYALDARTGTLLWKHDCKGIPGSSRAKPPKVYRDYGYAASTPVTDGRRVYAVFANGDLVATDMEGKRKWASSLGVPQNQWGFASSPIMWRDRLILLFDQRRRKPNVSELVALDSRSGDVVWTAKRDVRGSWTTPILVPRGETDELVTAADPWVIAYEPRTGRELWRAGGLGGFVAPSPIFDGERIVIVMEEHGLTALRPGGAGDVTTTHRIWTNEDYSLPDVSSPVSDGELVFTVSTSGTLSCFDAKTGKLVWREELELRTWVSPSLVGDRLIIFGQNGHAHIVASKREFREIGQAKLGEGGVFATPAFARVAGSPRMFVRTKKHLYCIGPPPSPAGDGSD
jgi:outer membrane protein assembly factor BamB